MVEWNLLLNFACMKVVCFISSRLLLVLLVLSGLCLPVLANPVDSLYVMYQNRDGKEKIRIANDIFKELHIGCLQNKREHRKNALYLTLMTIFAK